ncbi:hypothetical protein H6F77_12720 [Microcoleus sp. FACHB-831]|uniref:hypothetical protein n=1 Tax=Microcoleus sp. FACHB-831 TaxID=2692827 RepID=UPI001683C9CF|nr:hypothetical protein [Microcoleus sp. FACHB-831]MBD1921949.1 hypothetical protein [Microcoleus sp. FACHB-831]
MSSAPSDSSSPLQEPAKQSSPFAKQFREFILTHGLLTGVLLLALFSSTIALNKYGEIVGYRWLKDLKHVNPAASPKLKVKESQFIEAKTLKGTDAEKQRIREQLQELRVRATTHVSIMMYFYSRFFTSISIASCSSVIAGVSLFFISKGGWDSANRYVVNIFIVASGSAVYFGTMPVMYRQEQNVADNKSLYLQYVALENEALSYLATGENINNKQLELKRFIHYLDGQLAKTNQLAVGFDATQIPKYQEVYNNSQN